MQVDSGRYILEIDDRLGALRSLRGLEFPGQELLGPVQRRLPLFLLDYLDEDHHFCEVTSDQAETCTVVGIKSPDDMLVRMTFTALAGIDLNAEVTVRCVDGDPLSYWTLSLNMRAAVLIANVQFPMVTVPYRFQAGASTCLLVPTHVGEVYRDPRPEQLGPDWPDGWRFLEEGGHASHYPGTTFAQFLAHYDGQHGVYLGCHDAAGGVKIIRPVHRDGSIRLGVAHVTGWQAPGEYRLGYEVALGPFSGDWYDAADIYRGWYSEHANQQPRLVERDDVPAWLLDSPLHIVLRIQGELDTGPAMPHTEFVPYENALPLLQRVSQDVEAPVTPIIMAWERPGPWVYPDSFPVAGGDESLLTFTNAARARGWHVGTYCNGTRWVTGHKWTDYNGEREYRARGGERSVCRLPDGAAWRESWDRSWRPSYMTCMAAPDTVEIAESYVQHLLELGLDWIQFFDQNVGAATFPCYSTDHGHQAAPGPWMSDAMSVLTARLEARAVAAGRDVVLSVEDAPNDYFRSHFHICDIRPDVSGRSVPLYQYLFHEYIMTQGAFAVAPNPYWMQIKTASSFVSGDVLSAIMGQGGRLMAWAGHPWALWDTPAGDQAGIIRLLRHAIAMRRGAGRDYLVFGRMLRPAAVHAIEPITFTCDGQVATLPAILHARWSAPDDRVAITLANWTRVEQIAQVDLPPSRQACRYLVQTDSLATREFRAGGTLRLVLPPLSTALLETPAPR